MSDNEDQESLNGDGGEEVYQYLSYVILFSFEELFCSRWTVPKRRRKMTMIQTMRGRAKKRREDKADGMAQHKVKCKGPVAPLFTGSVAYI